LEKGEGRKYEIKSAQAIEGEDIQYYIAQNCDGKVSRRRSKIDEGKDGNGPAKLSLGKELAKITILMLACISYAVYAQAASMEG